MPLTLDQIASDLVSQTARAGQYGSERSRKNNGTVKDEPQMVSKQTVEQSTLDESSTHESIVDPIDQLVDSVRNIRAMTDEVMDARARIDEMLDNAKELKVAVASTQHNQH
ncbi:hypothetical protein H4R20_007079 [Coemansia guatemalensis]|uniref:Uncharacterized protein n=1 Tax=Coemansia guatemalensis TaxID=2761395 RepID=A0A9W8HTI1_9FUNG|nr:hypothetical protein H4R20_007079 [Coemansia guatemalensis]